jgi:hypothetical protein
MKRAMLVFAVSLVLAATTEEFSEGRWEARHVEGRHGVPFV